MPDAQLRGSFLKQCRQVTPAIGETVGEFKPIVSLNALYLYSSAEYHARSLRRKSAEE